MEASSGGSDTAKSCKGLEAFAFWGLERGQRSCVGTTPGEQGLQGPFSLCQRSGSDKRVTPLNRGTAKRPAHHTPDGAPNRPTLLGTGTSHGGKR